MTGEELRKAVSEGRRSFEAYSYGRWYPAQILRESSSTVLVGLTMTDGRVKCRRVSYALLRAAEGAAEKEAARSIVGVVVLDDIM